MVDTLVIMERRGEITLVLSETYPHTHFYYSYNGTLLLKVGKGHSGGKLKERGLYGGGKCRAASAVQTAPQTFSVTMAPFTLMRSRKSTKWGEEEPHF